jgi:predicted helicase
MSDVLEDLGLYVDIAVFDEAHKTTGEFSKTFSYALYDHNIKIAKRLFMTATQKVNPYSSNTLTMDNELVYGKVAHRLSMREAIEQGIVRDYQIVVVTIDKDMLSEENMLDPESRRHLMMMSLSKVMKEKNIKNGIVFQKTIQDSKSFVDLAKSSNCFPGFEINHVDGSMKTGVRKRYINSLSGSKPTILSNAKLLSEGIDTPALDMVGFFNPIKSLVDIVQRIGRAQRKQSDDDIRKGYLFLPLFVGSGVDFLNTDAEDFESWDFVINILSILREVDNKFKAGIEYYKQHNSFPNEIVDIVFDSEETRKNYDGSIIAT